MQDLVAWAEKVYPGSALGDETEFRLAVSQGGGVTYKAIFGDGGDAETLSEPGEFNIYLSLFIR